MPRESQPFEHGDLPRWSLEDWNDALYRHFFAVSPKAPAASLARLYVTGEDLRAACALARTADEARAAFINSLKRTLGQRSLAFDASRRRQRWNPESHVVPPFLSHLLLTCMVAIDLAEELRWTGNFRERLSQVLGTSSQPLLERLRPLWEDLATWSVQRNLAGAGCRRLRLPRIPDSGYHSIIGYSIRLAVPSRRDLAMLASLFGRNDLDGREPELNPVLHIVSSNIRRFSSEFGDVFNDFVFGLKTQPLSVLFHTTFWTAVREVALSGLQKTDRESSSVRIRLELEDDDGRFWLALTCDTELDSEETKSFASPSARQSPFQFVLTDRHGDSLVNALFLSERTQQKTDKLCASIRSAIAEGLLLFEESDGYVFVLSPTLPSSGQLRALVSERVKAPFKRAVESVGDRPEITRSAYAGWSEWRGLTVEGLHRIDLSRFPSIVGVHSLRLTLPPPEIKLRGGIRIGSSFVALPGALPRAEVPGADRVAVEIGSGEWEALERVAETAATWCFALQLPQTRLLGSHRIVASAASDPIAEREVDFIETAFNSDYKQPLDPSRWLVESAAIDAVPFSNDSVYTTPEEKRGPGRASKPLIVENDHRTRPLTQQQTPLIPLTTLLCARVAAQRGISEGELVPVMTGELGVKASEIWPILRAWAEAGLLEVLTDARWRARMYFGRTPRLVVHRRSSHYEAVLTGLVPPFLLERFDTLSSASGLNPVERRSVSEFVPALPRCRSHRIALLSDLARELNLPEVVQVRAPEEFLTAVRVSADQHSSTSHDSWSVYRRWNWKKRAFSENPAESTFSGISIEWCRRDDGPDRYKLYQEGSLLWWTRSRTWAILVAFTLAGVPVFTRQSGAAIESQGDSLYLPLPAARVVSWLGPANSGPVKLPDGKSAYRYTFSDNRARESVLAKLWPGAPDVGQGVHPMVARRVAAILRSGHGPVVPVPAGLRLSLSVFFKGHSGPGFVAASSLPQLYSALRDLAKGER